MDPLHPPPKCDICHKKNGFFFKASLIVIVTFTIIVIAVSGAGEDGVQKTRGGEADV